MRYFRYKYAATLYEYYFHSRAARSFNGRIATWLSHIETNQGRILSADPTMT